jgi:hypothetical protein
MSIHQSCILLEILDRFNRQSYVISPNQTNQSPPWKPPISPADTSSVAGQDNSDTAAAADTTADTTVVDVAVDADDDAPAYAVAEALGILDCILGMRAAVPLRDVVVDRQNGNDGGNVDLEL